MEVIAKLGPTPLTLTGKLGGAEPSKQPFAASATNSCINLHVIPYGLIGSPFACLGAGGGTRQGAIKNGVVSAQSAE